MRSITIYDWDAIFPLNDPAFIELARSKRITFARLGISRLRLHDKTRGSNSRFFRPHEANQERIDKPDFRRRAGMRMSWLAFTSDTA